MHIEYEEAVDLRDGELGDNDVGDLVPAGKSLLCRVTVSSYGFWYRVMHSRVTQI